MIAAVVSGTPREDVVWRFAASLATIKRWLRQWRETGDPAPKRSPSRPGVEIGALVAAWPARLAEQCGWWSAVAGVAVSTATMSRALARLRETRERSR